MLAQSFAARNQKKIHSFQKKGMTRGMWHLGYRWEFVAFKPYFGQTMSLGRMIDYKQPIAMIKNRAAQHNDTESDPILQSSLHLYRPAS